MQAPGPVRESHAHSVLAVFLLIVGVGMAYLLTPVLAALLGLFTLWCGWKFLKWRVDPMDMFFWMKSKPTWAAVGITFLCGLILFGIAYFVFHYVNDGAWISPYLHSKI